MKLLMPARRSTDNKLIISVALLFAFCGVCALLDVRRCSAAWRWARVITNVAENDKLFQAARLFQSHPSCCCFRPFGHEFQARRALFRVGEPERRAAHRGRCGLFSSSALLGKYIGAWVGCAAVKKDRSSAIISVSRSSRRRASRSASCGAGRADARRRDGKRSRDDHPRFERAV